MFSFFLFFNIFLHHLLHLKDIWHSYLWWWARFWWFVRAVKTYTRQLNITFNDKILVLFNAALHKEMVAKFTVMGSIHCNLWERMEIIFIHKLIQLNLVLKEISIIMIIIYNWNNMEVHVHFLTKWNQRKNIQIKASYLKGFWRAQNENFKGFPLRKGECMGDWSFLWSPLWVKKRVPDCLLFSHAGVKMQSCVAFFIGSGFFWYVNMKPGVKWGKIAQMSVLSEKVIFQSRQSVHKDSVNK